MIGFGLCYDSSAIRSFFCVNRAVDNTILPVYWTQHIVLMLFPAARNIFQGNAFYLADTITTIRNIIAFSVQLYQPLSVNCKANLFYTYSF